MVQSLRLKWLLIFFLFLHPAFAVTWGHANGANGSSGTSPYTLTLGFTPASGTLLIAGCAVSGTNAVTVSDNSSGPADVWTPLASGGWIASSYSVAAFATVVTAGTKPTTVTCTSTGAAVFLGVDDYTGGPSVVVQDGVGAVVATPDASGATVAVPYTTGSSAGDLVWTFTSYQTETSISVASPFTIRQSTASKRVGTGDDGIASGVAANTLVTATWTGSPSNVWMVGLSVGFAAQAAASTPTADISPGHYATTQTVTLSDTTPSSTILYTIDGSVPACPSTGNTYSTPLSIPANQTVRAVACATGYTQSQQLTAAYTIGTQTYYVDNCVTTGNDSNAGTSSASPWLTLNRVNQTSFYNGDTVLFQGGCVWREPTSFGSGGAGSPITYASYGAGQANWNGADLVTGWSLTSGTTYQAATTVPHQVLRAGTILTADGSTPTVDGHWYWAANVLYLCCGDPTGLAVEASHRTNEVDLVSQSYLTFSNLAITNADGYDVFLDGPTHDLNFLNISYLAGAIKAIYVGNGAYNLLFNGGQIVNNGSYSATAEGMMIGEDGDSPHDATVENIIFRNNANPTSAGNGAGVCCATASHAPYNIAYLRNSVSGSATGGIALTAGTSTLVAYNILFNNGNSGFPVYNVLAGVLDLSALVYNNTVASNEVTQANFECSWQAANGDTINATLKNDICYVTSANSYGGTGANPTTGITLTSDYNDIFSTLSETPFQWGASPQTLAQWRTATGGDAHSISISPQFANAAGGNFALNMTSPAIAKGTDIGGLTTDYYGNPVIPGFVSQGAIQYQPRPFGGVM